MKVPVCMATQHPDSTLYVPVQKEPEEALECLTSFECDEYMIDYEGKMTPYHQSAQIVSDILNNTKLVPGKDVFITPRMSSAAEEVVFRQLMAIMAIMEANYISISRTGNPAIVEAIHPMSKSYPELLKSKERVYDIMHIAKKELGLKMEWDQFNIIPLVEQVPQLLSIDGLVGGFIDNHKAALGFELKGLRVLLGKSDPAIGFGHVASALACKVAISDLYAISERTGVECSPIMGVGSLPFRGHLSLENMDNFLSEYSGIRTVTIQSGLRHNHGLEDTRKVVRVMKDKLPGSRPAPLSEEARNSMILVSAVFAKNYLKALPGLASLVSSVSSLIPNQRDRLVQRGSMGYSREVNDLGLFVGMCSKIPGGRDISRDMLGMSDVMDLPRAIKFTASFYVIGFPPEFIGTGRGLREMSESLGNDALDALLSRYYPSLVHDLEFAGRFINMKSLESFVDSPAVLSLLEQDLAGCIDVLGLKLEPDMGHNALGEMSLPYMKYFLGGGERIFSDEKELELKDAIKTLILRMSEKRKSLG